VFQNRYRTTCDAVCTRVDSSVTVAFLVFLVNNSKTTGIIGFRVIRNVFGRKMTVESVLCVCVREQNQALGHCWKIRMLLQSLAAIITQISTRTAMLEVRQVSQLHCLTV